MKVIRTLTTTLALAVLSAALAGFFVLAALLILARRVADRVVGHIFARPRSSAAASHELDMNCGIAATGARSKRRKVNWGSNSI